MLNQVKTDLLCDLFASMTASEETFPMIQDVFRDVSSNDPCV